MAARTIGEAPALARGDEVEVREPGIRPWTGTVLSLKPSPRSGWWAEVRQDDGSTWVVCLASTEVRRAGEEARS